MDRTARFNSSTEPPKHYKDKDVVEFVRCVCCVLRFEHVGNSVLRALSVFFGAGLELFFHISRISIFRLFTLSGIAHQSPLHSMTAFVLCHTAWWRRFDACLTRYCTAVIEPV